jgi:hypothetical protein
VPNTPRFDLISNILRLSRGVTEYVATIGWIVPTDPLAPRPKLVPADAQVLGVVFAPWRAIVVGNAFVPAASLAPTMSLALAMLFALAMLLVPTVSLAPAVLLAPAVC